LKKVFLLFWISWMMLFFTACSTQEQQYESQLKIDMQKEIREHLQVLCSEKMAGREGGTEGEAEAALYLANFLKEKKLQPAGEEETFFQSFPIKGYMPRLGNKRMTYGLGNSFNQGTSENVLALLEGKTQEVIVVSAHYDHLGIINGQLYPGANDNASGVAVVLEIINALADCRPERTILFAFWGSEEKGLLGSRYFCNNPTIPIEEIQGIVNFDTVGNLKEKKELLGWKVKENEATTEIVEKMAEDGWQINWQNNSGHSSDHFSFSLKNIAGFTLLSPDWLEKNHTPLDEVKGIRISPMHDLVNLFINILK